MNGLQHLDGRGKVRSWAAGALMLALALLAGGCAPVVSPDTPRPVVAVINGPGEERPTQATAEIVQARVEEVPGCCTFSFMRSAPLRFQETHRNLYGSRAVPNTAALARNLTVDHAVLVGLPTFERELEEHRTQVDVSGKVRLRAQLIDAQSGEVLATVPSRVYRGSRTQSADEDMPDEGVDPLMRELIDRAAADVAPHVAALLEDIAEEWRAAQAGE